MIVISKQEDVSVDVTGESVVMVLNLAQATERFGLISDFCRDL
jgi:hypothetical protein